jgi:phenylacetate-CoA ligase
MTMHYDALETRPAEQRDAALMAALSAQIAHAKTHTSAFAASLRDIDAAHITSRTAPPTRPMCSAASRRLAGAPRRGAR